MLALRSDKIIQDIVPIFCSKVSMSKFFKTLLHSPPLNNTVLELIFTIFTKRAKNAQRHKKIKTKARYEISTIKLVLKSGTFEK